MKKLKAFYFYSYTVYFCRQILYIYIYFFLFQAKYQKNDFIDRPILANNLRRPPVLLFASKAGKVCSGSVTRFKAAPVLGDQSTRNLEIINLTPGLHLLKLHWSSGLLKDLQTCFIWKVQNISCHTCFTSTPSFFKP